MKSIMKSIQVLTLSIFLLSLSQPVQSAAKSKKKSAKQTASYKEVSSEEEFSKLLSKSGTFVIKFYAPSCGACKHIEPHFKKVAAELSASATFVAVNTSANNLQDLARTFNITALPTTFFITKKVGVLSEDELNKLVHSALGTVHHA